MSPIEDRLIPYIVDEYVEQVDGYTGHRQRVVRANAAEPHLQYTDTHIKKNKHKENMHAQQDRYE
jgi:hypothetical protein